MRDGATSPSTASGAENAIPPEAAWGADAPVSAESAARGPCWPPGDRAAGDVSSEWAWPRDGASFRATDCDRGSRESRGAPRASCRPEEAVWGRAEGAPAGGPPETAPAGRPGGLGYSDFSRETEPLGCLYLCPSVYPLSIYHLYTFISRAASWVVGLASLKPAGQAGRLVTPGTGDLVCPALAAVPQAREIDRRGPSGRS